jgi:hypothetical protein
MKSLLFFSLLATTGVSSLNLPRQASSSGSASGSVTVTRTATTSSQRQQPTTYNWQANSTTEFPIHSSCNVTERNQIKQGLDEAVILARHAKDHVLRFSNSSMFYRRYFGNAPTAEVIGW